VSPFKNPLIASFNLKTQASLLGRASLDPPRLPMNGVDVNDGNPGQLAQSPGQRAFARPRLPHNHDALHASPFLGEKTG
jgi:hypothetical protein